MASERTNIVDNSGIQTPQGLMDLCRINFDSLERVGVVIKRLREEKGLSEGSLAAKAGLSNYGLRKIESPEGNPQIGTVISLARALEVSASTLFGESDTVSGEELKYEVVGENLTRLSVNNRQTAGQMAQALGIAASTMSRIENGADTSEKVFRRAVIVYRVSPSSLLNESKVRA